MGFWIRFELMIRQNGGQFADTCVGTDDVNYISSDLVIRVLVLFHLVSGLSDSPIKILMVHVILFIVIT